MIGIYDDGGDRLAMAYRSLTINDESYPVSSVVVDHRYDSVTEPKPQADGMEAYAVRRLVAMIRADGVVKADSVADLHDKVEALNAAFDPVLAFDEDTATRDIGFLPFTFSVPTADDTGYPTGLKPLQYYVRSTAIPVPRISKFEGDGAHFTLLLQAVDPRRYLQTLTSVDLFHTPGGTPDSASVAVDNSLASYSSWPTITMVMSGFGHTAFYVDHDESGVDPLVLDLSSLVATDVVTIDMQAREVLVDGASRMDLVVSGDFFPIRPGTQNVESGWMAGVTSCVMSYRRAFV